jgi:hypothetical protein
MRRLSFPLALGVLFSFGCLFGKKDDTDTSDPDGDGIEQSDVCADYLTCAAAVAPDSFAGLSATYGPSGDCWSQGQDFADNCTTVCQTSVEALATQHPTDDACKAYAPPFPMADGTWTLNLGLGSGDECGIGESLGSDTWTWEGDVVNDFENGSFTWSIADDEGFYNLVLDCTDDGTDFDCEGDFMQLTGTGEVSTAEGTYTINGGSCTSSGDFDAESN